MSIIEDIKAVYEEQKKKGGEMVIMLPRGRKYFKPCVLGFAEGERPCEKCWIPCIKKNDNRVQHRREGVL